MPPYKFDSSRAWGRHYGQDFGGGGAPILLVIGNTAAAVNQVAYSLDGGLSWAQGVAPAPGGLWNGAAFAPSLGYAIMISQQGSVARSFDGITWTAFAGENLDNSNWGDVLWDPINSRFVAVGIGGVAGLRASTSPDGQTWTNRPTPNVGGVTSAAWSELLQNPQTGAIIAASSTVSNPTNIVSLDGGLTWAHTAGLPTGNDTDERASAFFAPLGRMFFFGGQAISLDEFYTDNDGVSWSRTNDTGLGSQATSGACQNLANGNLIRSSVTSGLWRTPAASPGPPGNPWVNAAAGVPYTQMADLLWTPETLFVGVATTGNFTIVRSVNNGVSWTSQAFPIITARKIEALYF